MALKKKKTSVPKFRPGAGWKRSTPPAAPKKSASKKKTTRREDVNQAAARILREATEH